ncbi:MAG: hypothetical protein AB1551_05845 [Actinomycetota bacterium]
MTKWPVYLVRQEFSEESITSEFARADPIGNRGPEPADLSSEGGRRWLRLEAAARLEQGQGGAAVKLLCAEHPQRLGGHVKLLPAPFGASMLSFTDNTFRLESGLHVRAREWFCWLFDIDRELVEVLIHCPAGHGMHPATAPVVGALARFRATGKVQRLLVT